MTQISNGRVIMLIQTPAINKKEKKIQFTLKQTKYLRVDLAFIQVDLESIYIFNVH